MSTRVASANSLTVYFGTDATRATTTTGAPGERLPISNLTSCEVTFNQATEDATNRDSNRWRETILGQRDVSISGSGQLDTLVETSTTHRTISAIRAALIVGTEIYVEIGVGNARLQGQYRIINMPISQDTNTTGTFSFEFESNGEQMWSDDVTL